MEIFEKDLTGLTVSLSISIILPLTLSEAERGTETADGSATMSSSRSLIGARVGAAKAGIDEVRARFLGEG